MSGEEIDQKKENKMIKNLTFLIALVLFSGCSFRPELPTKQASFEADLNTANISANWWEDFNDSLLNQIVNNALNHNSDLALMLNNLEMARVNLGLSKLEYLPNITLGGSATRGNNLPQAPNLNADSSYALNSNLSYELDLWGRVRNTVKANQSAYNAKKYDLQTARQSVIANTILAYYTLATLSEQNAILSDTVKTYQDTLNLRQKQYQVGEIDALTYNQALSQLNSAKTEQISIKDSYEKAQTALNVLSGTSYDEILKHSFNAKKLAKIPALPSGVPSDYLLLRPDVASALENLKASNALVGVARANYFPRISLTGAFGYASMDFDRLIMSSASSWSIAGSFVMPLLDFGRTAKRVEISNLEQNASFIAYDKSLKNAFGELRNALNARKNAIAKQKSLNELLKSATSVYKAALDRYNAGYSSHLDLLDAQRALLNARLAKANGDLQVASAVVEIYKAFGGGFRLNDENTIELINAKETITPTDSINPFADL